MAFPTVRSSAETDGTAASATPAITLPATVQQNDVLFVVFRVAVAGAIGWPAGWTELFDASSDAADDQMAAAWKRATGAESGTSITLSCTSGKFAAVAYAIKDSADPHVRPPELSTVATGTSTTPNATTVTPTGGAQDYLWLTFTGREGEATLPPTYPTNYTVNQHTADSGTASTVGTNVRVSGAVRTNNNAASEDAGAWTFSDTEDWTAYTIAFHPTPANPTPGTLKQPPPLPIVTRPRVAAAVGFALLLPIQEGVGPPADASSTDTGPQVYQRSAVQYTPIAGPMVTGEPLSWLSRPPGLVPRAVTIRSVYAAPATVQQQEEISIGWLPRQDDQVGARPAVRSEYARPPTTVQEETSIGWLPRQDDLVGAPPIVRSAYARPSTETATAPVGVQWWPKHGRLVRRNPFVAPFTAPPPIAPTLPAVSAADAVSSSTGPMVWPRGTVQYTAIAGPVLVPSAATPDRSLTFNDDGLIRPDRYTHYHAAAGPVAIPPPVGWWTPPGRIVARREPVRAAVIVKPPHPLNGAGRSDLPWLMPQLPLVRRIPPTRHLSAAPVNFTVADAASQLPWLMRGLPSVLAKYPTRHVLVLPVSATAGALPELPWLRPVLPLVLATRPARAVLVTPLGFSAQAPDRSLTFNDDGLIRPDRYTYYHAVSGPVAIPFDTGWMAVPGRIVQRVRLPLGVVRAVPISPLNGAFRSDLPWLRPFLPNVLPVYPTRQQIVLVPAVPATQIDIPWLTLNLPLVQRRYPTRSVLVLPVSATTGALSNLPWLRPNLAHVLPVYPTRHQVVLVPAIPAGQIDIPWLRPVLPLVLARYPTRHQLVVPPTNPSSAIPWLMQQVPLVIGEQPTRQVHVKPPRTEVADLPWLKTWLPVIQKQYPNRPILVMPATVPASALSNIPWLKPWQPLVLPTYPTRNQLSQVLLDNYGPNPTPDVIILVQADVGIIRVRPDVGIILVLPDVGDVEA